MHSFEIQGQIDKALKFITSNIIKISLIAILGSNCNYRNSDQINFDYSL